MRTIVIAGGTDGIGKQLALQFIRNGEYVIVIGRSSEKGEALRLEAKKLDGERKFLFLQADLSIISETIRIIHEVSRRVNHIDQLILCAQSQKLSKVYRETKEGIEHHFSLYYLSRFILSFQFRELLTNATAPLIINVCAPGVKGDIEWDDLQLQNQRSFNSIKAIMHGSRLNNLLGAAFAQSTANTNIKYVLFNPGAVQTKGATEAFDHKMINIFVKLMYKIIGLPVQKAVEPILHFVQSPPEDSLTAYKQNKKLDIAQVIPNKDQPERLVRLTLALIKQKYGDLMINYE
ncbi:SDR family NAD(P)-dependent oxidoreductase [Paenibacillus sp. GSMTC-2017]|uniref:SDR family NAD(P)-dependent oxidoreductase n=1 Tax=Paenibacillus sp. GSMTC-2017 TaxID=2794350 RepID=UPI0018D94AD5|nr:SDR family NAD(P)-dependent oxidoreductase [Paenibacillus sp. GSMTC-2017]MBH5319382.1 SDR family NAD(P)-dependent oxidoreductase [Paenibacillus sp. GSMTC-2017]